MRTLLFALVALIVAVVGGTVGLLLYQARERSKPTRDESPLRTSKSTKPTADDTSDPPFQPDDKTADAEKLPDPPKVSDKSELKPLNQEKTLYLEIPEAGDWTDLFGRSYHVLYDEVLWYRATVCYGLLLEMLGELDAAAEYLRRAQRVSAIIMQRFWPTTRPEPNAPGTTFADRQYSIGDASYLLAELTPFQFNWRCDVFGNVLAFLWGVLDIDRARRVFRFMWGAGVNAPYPVVNLYPAVQAGDPDWKAYYTVNMLNLPHHYHNGGIWPFIGGMWVRYIDRLGGRRVAERELYNLALLNRQGRVEQWEFNEWAHGATGKPMGKRYQAWSAASFIHACHELGVAGELRRSQ